MTGRARDRATQSDRVLFAIAFGAAGAALAYAIARVSLAALMPEPNPAALVWSSRSSFFFRVELSLYAGGLLAFGGHALAARAFDRGGRALLVAFAVSAIALVAQAVLVP